MLVLPSITVPAAASARPRWRRMARRSCRACASRWCRTPSVQKMSLCAIGRPVSGPASPAARRSAAFACASAGSRVTVMKALSFGRARRCARACARELDARKTVLWRGARSRAPPAVYAFAGVSLFDDLGHEIQRPLRRSARCVGRSRVGPFGHDVRPQALRLAGERMRHRLDTRLGRRIRAADEVDDPRQAVLVDGDLGFGDLEPGEMRDAVDLLALRLMRKLKQKA